MKACFKKELEGFVAQLFRILLWSLVIALVQIIKEEKPFSFLSSLFYDSAAQKARVGARMEDSRRLREMFEE